MSVQGEKTEMKQETSTCSAREPAKGNGTWGGKQLHWSCLEREGILRPRRFISPAGAAFREIGELSSTDPDAVGLTAWFHWFDR